MKGSKNSLKGATLSREPQGEEIAATIELRSSKKPKEIDITVPEDDDGEKRTMPGIYVLNGDTLTMCVAESGAPRPTEIKPTQNVFVWVFERVKPGK